ncbi:hypothetical protein BDD12DRAFT_726240, partial [Trichophaea hybrida]
KSLYRALQNAQDFPEALPAGRKRLLELLDHTVNLTLSTSSQSSTILSIPSFSPESLNDFLQSAEDATTAKFDAYLHHRKQGSGREMFPNREYAEYWIWQSAPVKYVDGAWLGGVHRIDTLPKDRRWSKTAWQILSEELGDGDLEKNHVAVYEKLVNSVCDIGRGDERRFIDSAVNPNNDARVWTAAVSQLAVSLYADELLPEILGFNMAYELLPYHLLLTIHELRELDLDPYYFLLHVIDSGDCGHATMGLEAVVGLINAAETEEEQAELWRRVQAGFILAESLPTTPTPPSRATNRIIELFGRKAVTARPMHTSCPAEIGGKSGKTLAQWLDPDVYNQHCMVFIQALVNSRWIVRGDPKNSKLIQELRWGGRMFGAFTLEEVDALRMWIEELNDTTYLITPSKAAGAYQRFVGRTTLDRSFPPLPHTPSLPDPPPKALGRILDLPPIEL